MKLTDRDIENIIYLAKLHVGGEWTDELTALIDKCADESARREKESPIATLMNLVGKPVILKKVLTKVGEIEPPMIEIEFLYPVPRGEGHIFMRCSPNDITGYTEALPRFPL